MDLILFLLVLVLLGLGAYLLFKVNGLQHQLAQTLEGNADNLSDQMTYQLDTANKQQLLELTQLMNRQQADLYQQLTDIRDVLHRSLSDSRDRSDKRLEKINQQVNQSLKNMQESNEKRLEEMRQIVEEKLEETLKNRLHASFDSVSKQLESVNKGLGEMRSVAQDVGTLNKVLSNTKTRGILGELQLGQIIEDIMTSSQYEREFVTVSGSSERVEYAIKLPGNGQGGYIYLPIDSKFPLEDYYRLEDAYEVGDKLAIEASRKALLAAIKRFAKDIHKKYLNPQRRPISELCSYQQKVFIQKWSEMRLSLIAFVGKKILWLQVLRPCLLCSIPYLLVSRPLISKKMLMTSVKF